MPTTISKHAAGTTSLITTRIDAAHSVASDEWMIANGYREMTAEESAQSARMFACADRSNIIRRVWKYGRGMVAVIQVKLRQRELLS